MVNVILGKELKQFRIQQGLTQVKLAEMVGVSDKVLQWWETGRHLPNELNAYKLKQVVKDLNGGIDVKKGSIVLE
jgi:transcriptional regulator with XRE-family HTH domain